MRNSKTTILFALLQLSIIILSCSDQDLNTEVKKSNIEAQKERGIRTSEKSILGTYSKSNPNLYNDWENTTTIYLNGGKTVDAPWVIQGGNTMNIPDNIRVDIKKENGWIMLGHTMTEETSIEPNFMIFYHKKSGMLKGFYLTQDPDSEYFIWTLEADQPSSIIPTNTIEANLANVPTQYSSTSNILKSSIVNSHSGSILRYGWNCFTFELPYGQTHMNPIIQINGYSIPQSKINLNEIFSGEVIVPSLSSSNKIEPWAEHWGKVNNLSNGITTFEFLTNSSKKTTTTEKQNYRSSDLELISIMTPATSIVASLLGGASSFVSKNKTVTNRYKTASNTQLNSNIINDLEQSLSTSLNNIDIKALNNNEELGVWGLKESPKIRLEKYGVALGQAPRTRSESNTYTRIVNLAPIISKDGLIINPKLRPLIKNYTVSTKCIFSTKEKNNQLKLIPSNLYKQIADHWYAVEITSPRIEITKHLNPDNYYLPPGKKEHTFYFEYMDRFPETYIDVTVIIEYNDGEIFSSGRVFKIDGTVHDNKQEILKSQSKTSFNPVFL